MPRIKWNPTRAEQREYKALLERLNAAGAELELSDFGVTDSPRMKITQDPLMLSSYVRAFHEGPLFVIQVAIVALAPKVIIRNYDLSNSEWDLRSYFMVDPMVKKWSNQYYRLPDGTEFLRSEVLNHRVGAEGTLRRGDLLEGVLLAAGFAPVPPCYPPGSRMSVNLSITDQFGDVCDTKLELLVEQPATLPHLRRIRGGGLFEPEDAPIGVPDLSGETPVSERNTRGSRGSVQNKGAIRLFRMTRKSDERELVGRLFGTLKGLCANCGCLPRLAAPASSDSLRRGTGARHIARPRPGAARSPEASLLHKDGAQSDHLRSSAGSSSSKPRTSCEPWPSGNPGRQTGNQFFPAVFASLERYGDVSSVTGGA